MALRSIFSSRSARRKIGQPVDAPADFPHELPDTLPPEEKTGAQPEPGVAVCKSPLDLPGYDAIISGVSGLARVKLTVEQAKYVVVMAKGKSVNIVASSALCNSAEALALFEHVRHQLHAFDYGVARVIWAVPNLVADLNDLRPELNPRPAGIDQFSAKKTDHWKRFIGWIRYGLQVGASDLHVEVDGPHARIRFRVDGIMVPMQNDTHGEVLAQPARESIALAFNSISDIGTATGSNFNSSEFLESIVSVEIDGHAVKLRCDSIPTEDGFNFIARFSRANQSYTYDTFGYDLWHQQHIRRAIAARRGMIVLAGIPGSGKTSAVQIMLEDLAKNDTLKISTIDTPIEKKLAGVAQTLLPMDESNPEESVKLFNKAIQHWVRGNPDVMSLGEIRSAASARAAVMLAEIGCLLFGTTHAHSCLGIFQRLISIGVDIYSLTAPGIMNLFIHQSLVPVLCKSCRVPLAAMPAETRNTMRDIGSRLDVCTDGMYYQNLHSACQYCRGTGIRGRTVVCEMIQHDVKLLDFILRRDLHAAEKYWHERSDGRYDTSNFTGKSSFYHAFILAQRGVISPDEVCKFGFFDDFSAPSTQRATSCQEVVP